MRRHLLLLIERMHLTQVLRENRVEFLRQKYVPLINATYNNPEDRTNQRAFELSQAIDGEVSDTVDANFVFDWAATHDPSGTKKYLQWILNGLLKQWWPPEDAYKLTEYLDQFEKVQRHMPVEQRDINRYRTLGSLYAAMEPYLQAKSQREEDRALERQMHAEAKVLLDTAEYKIVTPLTQAASCHFGRNTQWCTAATSSWNAFDSYNKQGPLYIILDKKHNQRWQFHVQTKQFMDENDRQINLEHFLRTHSVVAKFFEDQDGKVMGKIGDGIVLAKPEGGLMIKDRPGLLGTVLLDVKVDANNVLTGLGTPNSGLGDRRASLDYARSRKFSAFLNQLKITGVSQPHVDLYFGKGQWSNNLTAVGDKVIGDGDSVWYKTNSEKSDYYGLVQPNEVQQNEVVLGATVLEGADGAIRFSNPQSRRSLLPVKVTLDEVTEMAAKYAQQAIDLTLHLPGIISWVEGGWLDTRPLTRDQVKQLIKARPDFLLTMSAYLKVYGVDDEIKKHLAYVLEQKLVGAKRGEPPEWVGNRLVVDRRQNVYPYLLGQFERRDGWVYAIKELYGEGGAIHVDTDVIYPAGPQQILSVIPSATRLEIGKRLRKYAHEYVRDYDPASSKDIWQVISGVVEEERHGRFDKLVVYALRSATFAGARQAIEMTLISAIGNQCPDALYFEHEPHQFSKDVDLLKPVALLPRAETLVEIYDHDATKVGASSWDQLLQIKFDFDKLLRPIPADQFDLTIAAATFLTDLGLKKPEKPANL